LSRLREETDDIPDNINLDRFKSKNLKDKEYLFNHTNYTNELKKP